MGLRSSQASLVKAKSGQLLLRRPVPSCASPTRRWSGARWPLGSSTSAAAVVPRRGRACAGQSPRTAGGRDHGPFGRACRSTKLIVRGRKAHKWMESSTMRISFGQLCGGPWSSATLSLWTWTQTLLASPPTAPTRCWGLVRSLPSTGKSCECFTFVIPSGRRSGTAAGATKTRPGTKTPQQRLSWTSKRQLGAPFGCLILTSSSSLTKSRS
mmetsp:Transcript_45591/g.98439  ORF Transcript_45591/g.98439 Transcript_45591/m.98439 type:complete len:212 (+) Transcript_45591:1644-2279(+)